MTVINVNGKRFVENPPWGDHGATLNTIPHFNTLIGHCQACDRIVEVDRETVPPRLHHSSLTLIAKSLRCTCGEKSAKILVGYYAVEWPDVGKPA